MTDASPIAPTGTGDLIKRDAFLDMLRDEVRKRFGEVDFVLGDTWRNHVYICRSYDPLVVSEASVAFQFPGQQIAPATLDYRHTSRPSGADMIGPEECRVHCCNGDREAFEAWAEITKLRLANEPGRDGKEG